MLLLLQGYGVFAPPSLQSGLIFDPGHHTTYLRSSYQHTRLKGMPIRTRFAAPRDTARLRSTYQHTRLASERRSARQSVGRRGSAYRARKKIMRKDTPDAHD
jgi:hypothetical protein